MLPRGSRFLEETSLRFNAQTNCDKAILLRNKERPISNLDISRPEHWSGDPEPRLARNRTPSAKPNAHTDFASN
jgi:hypothetical protein